MVLTLFMVEQFIQKIKLIGNNLDGNMVLREKFCQLSKEEKSLMKVYILITL
jgi:hypothetical protein